jgi:xanthine dehydrogenase accessory factor
MIEIIKEVYEWLEQDSRPVVIAVLVDLEGSAVRGRGAVMAVNQDGLMAGSVSGGCIESTVLVVAERVFETGQAEIIKFCKIDDEILGSVSPCGGEVTISVAILNTDFFESFCNYAQTGKGGSWGLISAGPDKALGSMFLTDRQGNLLRGSFSGEGFLSEKFQQEIRENSLCKNKSDLIIFENYEIFSTVLNPSPHLIIIGASHIGIALASVAELTGYRHTIIDPRAAFTNKDRFKTKSKIFKTWPRKALKELELTPYTAVAVITHDTKIDDQALKLVLDSECFYVGALGSRLTHKERIERLLEARISESDCNKIYSPIGLNIKSANPEEIAISIMAEVVKVYREKFGK